MNRSIIVMSAACCLTAATCAAVPNGRVIGAVAGTAAGLIIANNVRGVNPWVAAPVGALVGGYIGSRYEHDRHDDRFDRCAGRFERRPHERYGRYHRDDYRYRSYGCDYYPYPERRVVVIETKTVAPKPDRSGPPAADPQPGVDLIKVSILNSNGIRSDVPILRVKGKFVGPQGETYEAFPTTEMLTKRYGM